jgi:hypothetical protein
MVVLDNAGLRMGVEEEPLSWLENVYKTSQNYGKSNKVTIVSI